MPTLNYTTSVPASRTISEMQGLLVKHGAGAVVTHYTDQRASGLSFTLTTPHGARSFTLPVDVAAVHRLLTAQANAKKIRAQYAELAHAERVAWRVAKDWLAAQLAIIEAQMATLDQVMLPYLHVDGQKTLYQAFVENEHRALPPAPEGSS